MTICSTPNSFKTTLIDAHEGTSVHRQGGFLLARVGLTTAPFCAKVSASKNILHEPAILSNVPTRFRIHRYDKAEHDFSSLSSPTPGCDISVNTKLDKAVDDNVTRKVETRLGRGD